jgi:PAS domain-containing protein
MTSLPMPACLATAAGIPLSSCVEISRGETELFLLQAFRSFAEAADSLERPYGMLRSEVARLHGELEQSNAGLAKSLEENRQMRQHLDRILDGLPCGVLVAKADGAISLVNPEGRRLLGLGKVNPRTRQTLATAQVSPPQKKQIIQTSLHLVCGDEPRRRRPRFLRREFSLGSFYDLDGFSRESLRMKGLSPARIAYLLTCGRLRFRG